MSIDEIMRRDMDEAERAARADGRWTAEEEAVRLAYRRQCRKEMWDIIGLLAVFELVVLIMWALIWATPDQTSAVNEMLEADAAEAAQIVEVEK